MKKKAFLKKETLSFRRGWWLCDPTCDEGGNGSQILCA
jgi:hypothetical protein